VTIVPSRIATRLSRLISASDNPRYNSDAEPTPNQESTAPWLAGPRIPSAGSSNANSLWRRALAEPTQAGDSGERVKTPFARLLARF
jgi:hypothetical protein